MLVNRNGELETDGNVAVIQEYTLKHDIAGFTYDNGPYFVMERYDDRLPSFQRHVQPFKRTGPFLHCLSGSISTSALFVDLGLGPAYWVLAFFCLISSFYFILFFLFLPTCARLS